MLNRYGYADAENILDEWNYMEDWAAQGPSYRKLCGMHGAAFCAASMIIMQQSPVDAACYFEADPVKEWCGIFEVKDMAIGRTRFATLKPRKPYIPFRVFGEMAKLGTEISSSVSSEDVYALGAAADGCFTGMITSFGTTPGEIRVTLSGLPAVPCTVTAERLCDGTDIGDDGKTETVMSFTAVGETEIPLPMRDDEILILRAKVK